MRVRLPRWLSSLAIVLMLASSGLSFSCRRAPTPPPVAREAPADAQSTSSSGASVSAPPAPGSQSVSAAPSAAASPRHPADSTTPPASASTSRFALEGPEPRDADAAREDIIEQVRPIVAACFREARGVQTGQRGRLRVVMRFDKNMKVHHVDTTPSGSVTRQVATCVRARVSKTRFRTASDTPRFLSFPVVLPPR